MGVRILAFGLFCVVLGCGGAADGPASVADAHAEADADAEADAKAHADADAKAHADADAEANADADSDAHADAGSVAASGILTLNLHCFRTDGTDFTDNLARFDAIAAQADGVLAVAVQEACVRGSESAIELLAAALAKRSGVKWSTTWAYAHRAWEGTANEADEGVGLLVRGELVDARTTIHRVQGPLVRVSVSATLPSGLRVTSVHFDHQDTKARAAQAREMAVAALVDSEPGFDAIVLGDFNARAGQDAHAAFSSFGFRDLSATLAANRIDHVFAHRGAKVAVAEARMLFDGNGSPRVSDHPGILVRLVPAVGEPVTPTRIVGRATLPTGNWLALRGATMPLDWTVGWPGRATNDGFRFVLTEVAGSFEVKLLRNDDAWMTGANTAVTAGSTTTIDATF